MGKLSSRMKFLTLVAVCSFLFLPAVSTAGEVPLGTLEFGVGLDTKYLELDAPTATSVLKELAVSVQNGSRKGKDRPSSAVVTVNGEEIFGQKNFNQNTSASSLLKTVLVDDPAISEVEVTVKINGRKGVRLSVSITAIYEESAPPDIATPCVWFLDTDMPPNYWGGPIPGEGTTDTPPEFDPRGIWVRTGGDTQ